ncbi:glycoside hydrolase family 140 protein [Flammeovirga yaeyamensis]|uniref:glycoside hydrolase family 140 protein n=1 Tax=Flammeovirga yaeyamensis TaxID=367791 RepID=UPI001F0ED604|nr:glycoside hydrolase family 140 protein [Flammeovirga yaeyamensis]
MLAQRLEVSDNGRYLVTEEGKPFFWLADTAWELFHRCDREEADFYLKKRAEQGFNVIQAVALAELHGLTTPNPYGHLPLIKNNPNEPNDAYFEHVDYIIKKADELGLYIALLPTWGDKLNTLSWGDGPEVFNKSNAFQFGKWIGNRYKDYDNIIWIIGGDRNPRENSDDVEVWNQMAEGIVKAAGGYDKTLMSFHPQPKEGGGSSTWFHQEKWLDFNMHQTGHCIDQNAYVHIIHDYQLTPIKPVIDGEPLYEDHPNCFNAKELGYSNHEDIRRIMYWNVFAGAFGQSYGCHDVWQMFKNDKEPINQPLRPWPEAMDLPMANQAKHLKNLMLSRPYLSRIPDQEIIKSDNTENKEYKIATRDSEGDYGMVYFPSGGAIQLDLTFISTDELQVWWFDPRTGNSFRGEDIIKSDKVNIAAPTSGKGNDWVLVIDAVGKDFDVPASVRTN